MRGRLRICPACELPIEADEPVELVGKQEYHDGCYEALEKEMETTNFEEDL